MPAMQLKLFKFEGAGNDFVAVEDLHGNVPTAPGPAAPLVRALCDRRRGLGADGVLFLSPPDAPGAHFRMHYYNADGSRGEMCGNGARCIVAFSRLLGLVRHEAVFDTDGGRFGAQLEAGGSTVRIAFPEIDAVPKKTDLTAAGEKWDADFLNTTGVYHLIVWVDDLRAIDIERVGPALSHHEAFAPHGTNVNFAAREPDADGTLRLRTYERGVEAETLACGTGAVATTASYLQRRGETGTHRLRLVPTGGDVLTVDIEPTGDGFRNVWLGGPARLVYTTTLYWDPDAGRLDVLPSEPTAAVSSPSNRGTT